jgi:hypothetical protein
MKNLFKLILFLVIVSSFNTAFAQTQSETARGRNLNCDSRCQGVLHNQGNCSTIKDQNTCNNRYVFKPYIWWTQAPHICNWGTLLYYIGQTGPVCQELQSDRLHESDCPCTRTYTNPSKGLPNVNQKCSSGRINYQGLCYTSCLDSYEMISAGICQVKGL